MVDLTLYQREVLLKDILEDPLEVTLSDTNKPILSYTSDITFNKDSIKKYNTAIFIAFNEKYPNAIVKIKLRKGLAKAYINIKNLLIDGTVTYTFTKALVFLNFNFFNNISITRFYRSRQFNDKYALQYIDSWETSTGVDMTPKVFKETIIGGITNNEEPHFNISLYSKDNIDASIGLIKFNTDDEIEFSIEKMVPGKPFDIKVVPKFKIDYSKEYKIKSYSFF